MQSAILKIFPYPTALPLVLQAYPVWEYGTPRDAYLAFASDLKYGQPARRRVPVRLQPRRRQRAPEVQALGARHAADTPYVFDTVQSAGYEGSEAERRLVEIFGRYFAAMATTGSPADPRRSGVAAVRRQ